MLHPTHVLALILVSAEILGAVQHKNYQQASGGARRGFAARNLQEEAAGIAEETGAQRNLYPGNANYVAVGANGAAEVAFRIDMSMFMERLNMIPQLAQVINLLAQRIEVIIDSGGQTQLPSVIERLAILEQTLISRIEQQDAKINGLYQAIQQIRIDVGGVSQEIAQLISIVQSSGSGSGGGSQCAQGIATVEGMVQQVMSVLAQIVQLVEAFGSSQAQPGSGGLGPNILDTVQQNFQLIQQSISMIQQIEARIGGPSSCPDKSQGVIQVLQQMQAVIALIEKLPQQITVVLQGSGLIGPDGSLIPYIQQVIQMCQAMQTEIVNLRTVIIESAKDMKKYFAENQRSLTAVKKVVTETTEIVQSSAAAAISASRALRCPTNKNQKADLED